MKKAAYELSVEHVLKEVNSSKTGLSANEADIRAQKFGRNVLRTEEKTSNIALFLSQFSSPVVWVLLAAMVITLAIGDFIDFYVITFVVLANSSFGFWQEYRAENAINSLRKLTSLKATVIRSGREIEIFAEDLVRGDIIVLETGDKVPADARLLEVANLQTQESSLTGESLPVKKSIDLLHGPCGLADQKNMVFAGTIIASGHAIAVVTEIGMRTQLGAIANLLKKTPSEDTPMQREIKHLAIGISAFVVLVAIVIAVIDFLLGKPFFTIITKSVALAVAAIPEGLLAVVTIALALGVQRMARKNALVRRLSKVETLGACNVICTDKTGTLTHNQMTVRKIFANNRIVTVTGQGYSKEGSFSDDPKSFDMLLRIGVLNNDARLHGTPEAIEAFGDPTETALLVSAQKANLEIEAIAAHYPRQEEIEFSAERKRMTTIHKDTSTGSIVAYTKGAPEILLGLCTQILINGKVRRLSPDDRQLISEVQTQFAKDSLRVLAFAYKSLEEKTPLDQIEKGLIFVGLQAMIDPPRREVREAIKICKEAGIRVVMITGDHLETAVAIARQIGLEGLAVSGKDIRSGHILSRVDEIGVYARVDPEDKLRIVSALQKRNYVVAMTGDGVNDAPALKKADLGIAMGGGTDVAKESSDLVLADDNFATIVNAVQEGRTIYDNIKKFVQFQQTTSAGEILTLFVATVIAFVDPMTARQILWVNIVTDTLPATALSVDPKEPGVMQRRPRGIHDRILTWPRILKMGFMAAVMATGTLFVFSMYNPEITRAYAQTMAFTTFVLFQLWNVLNHRSETESIFKMGISTNRWLLSSVVFSLVAQVIIIYVPLFNQIFQTTPLSATDWVIALCVSATILVFGELIKLFRRV